MQRVALLTYRDQPELTASDSLLIEPLAARGIQAVNTAWNDPAVDWASFDAAILRSTWDYHRQIENFRQWLDRVEAIGLRLFNPYPVVRWNMDKIYLRALQQRGIPMIPTVWGEEHTDLVRLLEQWEQVIIKPRYGASGEGSRIMTRSEADQPPLSLANCLIQPIMPQIREGEYSVIFLGGNYAFTVLKRPSAGQLFVQKEYGGSEDVITPPDQIVRQAADVLAAARNQIPAQNILYARVDGILDGDRFLLMELELIEPDLFLKHHPAAPDRFARVIAEAITPQRYP